MTWRDIGSELEARLAFQAFICVLRLQTDITTLLNTSILRMCQNLLLLPITVHSYPNTNALYYTFDFKLLPD